ncbi:hypothetical protein PIN31009_01811 [Pandoraea iniqua]|uniref:hypothetical protein n=1 Tax=Pandoraea iniqua TaxID=2508288 RepID=UPI00123FFFBC|nr:hypothetical protein [Pandoraea iniqua]VVD94733.1 hypothetical protein PIN31009_01811 [Pandoraea iniqua]
MSVKAVLGVLMGVAIVNTASAADSGSWITAAESPGYTWQAKKGSGGLMNVDGKKNNGYKYLYQTRNKSKGTYEYGQAFVLLESCKKGYGYVYYNGMEGQFLGKDAFVRFGPSVADNLGSLACLSWDDDTGKVSRQDNDNVWEVGSVAEKSGNRYMLKTDTVQRRSFKGKPSIAALSRKDDLSKKTFAYSEYVIAVADCQRGFGTMYELNFDGTVIDKSDVALNGDSVISGLTGALCGKL